MTTTLPPQEQAPGARPTTLPPRQAALLSASRTEQKGNIVVKWITSTDHKTIGYLYLIASVVISFMSAVGVGVGPDGLSLARLRDGAAYHFDLDQALRPGALSQSSRAADMPFGAPPWQRQDWHADQLRLMQESGRTSTE